MQPEETQDHKPEFDEFATDYDEALNRGLKLSGEGKAYFAEGRMRHLRTRLSLYSFVPSKVLDFGCGTGSATPFFFQILEAESLLGLDPSEESLKEARLKWVEFPADFSSETRNRDGQIDLAFCNGVFHHIVPEERDAALTTVWDHLKPGGWFAFWENNPWNPLTRYAMYLVPFDKNAILVWPQEARRLLLSRGFQVRHTDYAFFFPKCLSLFRPLERWLQWLPMGGQYLVLCQKPLN
jgi:SAM-dependent methyltransferase